MGLRTRVRKGDRSRCLGEKEGEGHRPGSGPEASTAALRPPPSPRGPHPQQGSRPPGRL